MTDRSTEWHENRRKSIGASEIAAVLGCNRYMSPLDVWLVKTGREPAFTGNEHTKRGQRQESQIIDWLAEELASDDVTIVRDLPPIQLQGTIATATPDGVICPDSHLNWGKGPWEDIWHQFSSDQLCIVEAKSTLRRVGSVAEIEMSHLMQCQWQMGVTGILNAKLCIFGPTVSDYECFDIALNPDLFAEMLTKASEWWERHVVGDLMPAPINSDDAYYIWPQDDGSAVDVSEAVYRHVCELKSIRERIKTLKEQDEKLVDRIKIAGQAAKELWYAGVKIATLNTIEPKPETKIREQRKPYRELRLKV